MMKLKDLEGGNDGLIDTLYQHLPRGPRNTTEKFNQGPCVSLTGVLVKIQAKHILNTKRALPP
jgi:hypothetical protein